MPRYVMASRRAGKFTRAAKEASIRSFESFSSGVIRPSAGISILKEAEPRREDARRITIFDAATENIAEIAARLPDDVILEPEYFYQPTVVQPLGLNRRRDIAAAESVSVFGADAAMLFRVRGGGGEPLEHAEVILSLRNGPLTDRVSGVTDANGEVTLRFSSLFTPTFALAIPYHGFWTAAVFAPSGTTAITCPKLPSDGPQDWRHKAVGAPPVFDETLGSGIHVGVIDTGCGPHPNLAHVEDAGAVIDGLFSTAPGAGADIDSHGTHVCGIVGAQQGEKGAFAGIAPGCRLTSIRVFPDPSGASNADIAGAIDVLSMEHDVDIINMSLGGPNSSLIIGDSIIDAVERGTLCIAAAGNSGGPVEFPAQHVQCLAISAIGLLGEAPAGTLSSLRVPDAPDEIGLENLFIANFSCRGPEIELAGPGVGVISTVPERHGIEQPYAGMDGTSMASPAVAGAVAAILSRNPTYAGLQRNQARTAFAYTLARQFARDIGLRAEFQGRGVPHMGGINPVGDVSIVS